MTPLVLGIDVSLTSTGIALMGGERPVLSGYYNIQTKGKKGDGPTVFCRRIIHIADAFEEWFYGSNLFLGQPDLAVMEAPSFNSRFGNPHERAGLYWRIFHTLDQAGVPVSTVAPATRAKYITGTGRGGKEDVLISARAQYGEQIPNDDVADAAGLAAMGMRALGHPVEQDITDKQLEAFEGVKSWNL